MHPTCDCNVKVFCLPLGFKQYTKMLTLTESVLLDTLLVNALGWLMRRQKLCKADRLCRSCVSRSPMRLQLQAHQCAWLKGSNSHIASVCMTWRKMLLLRVMMTWLCVCAWETGVTVDDWREGNNSSHVGIHEVNKGSSHITPVCMKWLRITFLARHRNLTLCALQTAVTIND